MIRRHSRSSEQMHYGPALHTVTGNYVAGKRKGVIGGVDFGSTGMVSLASICIKLHSCSPGPQYEYRSSGWGLPVCASGSPHIAVIRSTLRLPLQVRFVQADAVRKQLNGGHIVLLGNLAFSAAGEVLNCDCYSVATQAAIDLQADKLFCITTPSLQPFDLPQWLPISDAEQLLQSLLESKDKDSSAAMQQSGWILSFR